MTLLRRIGAAIGHALRHQRRHLGTSLMVMTVLATPIAVLAAVPLYSRAASVRLLDERIGPTNADTAVASSDLAFLYTFNRINGFSADWADVDPLDRLLTEDGGPRGLPLSSADRFVETEPFRLFAGDPSGDADSLGSVTLTSSTDFDATTVYIEGRAPTIGSADAGTSGDPVEVGIGSNFARELGVSAGQQLVLSSIRSVGEDGPQTLAIDIVGIWTDSGDITSLFGGDGFRKRLVVAPETITDSIAASRTSLIQNVKWRLVLDRTALDTDNIGSVLSVAARLPRQATDLLPGTREVSNPEGRLRAFVSDERALRNGLRGFSLPLLALTAGVGVLMINVALRSRTAEFAILRRRGQPRWSLIVTEATLAATVTAGAAALGVGIAFGLAEVIGRTRTFFRFAEAGPQFAPAMTGEVWRVVVTAAAGVFVVQLVASTLAARRAGRELTTGDAAADRPWWQRSHLDLFGVVVIGLITWRGVDDDDGRAALLDDPAVVVLPAATALAGGLLLLRVTPVLMRALARVLERGDGIAALTAARRAGRVPGDTAAPLLLLVITASLATFTASLAVTLDLHLLDNAHHRVGGEQSLVDQGRVVPLVGRGAIAQLADAEVPPLARTTTGHPDLADYERVWGVDRASATIDLVGSAVSERQQIGGLRFLGVAPESFADVAFWRSDYADTNLSDLMARMTTTPNGVLLGGRALSTVALGDEFDLELRIGDGAVDYTAVLVGRIEQFPTWYPDVELPLVVGSGQLVEDLAGATFDRRVVFESNDRFLDTALANADFRAIGADNRRPLTRVDAVVDRAQTAPGRQGVLGMLTIGVGLATALTLAGFVITTVLAFRRRSIEIGVLRAMGVQRGEVAVLSLFDLGTVMVIGLAASIGMGLVMSRWFIPILVDTPPGAAPELLPEVAWGATAVIAAVLAGLLVLSALTVVWRLRRVRVFESIRLGEV